MRDIVEPTQDEYGDDRHPAWALIGASRVSHGPQGAVLFDSEIRHNHYVTVKISEVSRKRDLNRDWLHAKRQIIEVAMSEAQWASFVSSMNAGEGVPCTVLAHGQQMPGMPYEPRLQQSMDEVRTAADKALEEVREAFAAYKAHKTVGNLRTLETRIDNATPNVTFAAKSLTEHAENVVQKARVDIEAMVMAKARQAGLEPGDLGDLPALTAGE